MMNRRAWLLLLALLLLGLAGAAPAAAQSAERCFPQTGYCISGPIRAYWERNGGLPVFGYPISPVQTEGVDAWYGPVQWFERDRLEDHSAEGLGVLAGRLGAQLLLMQGRPWETLPKSYSAPAGCRYFEATNQTLCGKFLSYWQQNGGIERFGYPISQEMTERIGDWSGTVQYFERRRMELHTELPGSPVLLGLLGRGVADLPGRCFEPGPPLTATAAAYRSQLGCAYPYPLVRDAAYQPFERGAMLWMPGIGSRLGNGIMVFTRDPATGVTTYQTYNDRWFSGEPESGGETAPAGLFEPRRGFGKIWREIPGVRERLGWATAPEAPERAILHAFERGSLILRQSTSQLLLLESPTGQVRELAFVP